MESPNIALPNLNEVQNISSTSKTTMENTLIVSETGPANYMLLSVFLTNTVLTTTPGVSYYGVINEKEITPQKKYCH